MVLSTYHLFFAWADFSRANPEISAGASSLSSSENYNT
jgi:hypothetical protein